VTRSSDLWKWAQHRIFAYPTINAEHRFTLAKMGLVERDGVGPQEESVQDRDLTVLVTATFPYPQTRRSGITPRGFLRVWDGTGMSRSDP
jgi:hypothetical protein